MRHAVTISLPPILAKDLNAAAKRKGQTRSQYVQEVLKKDLFLEHIDQVRKRLQPIARRRGWYTDEDIFREVS